MSENVQCCYVNPFLVELYNFIHVEFVDNPVETVNNLWCSPCFPHFPQGYQQETKSHFLEYFQGGFVQIMHLSVDDKTWFMVNRYSLFFLKKFIDYQFECN